MIYENLLKGLQSNDLLQQPTTTEIKSEISNDLSATPISKNQDISLFQVESFIQDIKEKSAEFNKKYFNITETINAYDVAHNCIRIPIFKLRRTPITDYANNWLPISFRAELGNAAHEFIQNTSRILTETELSLRVPSLNVSVRLDAVINDNVLVEIKSVPYKDYQTILRRRQPRNGDFLQAVLYRHLLENHLDEIKRQTPSRGYSLPKLNNYNIRYIQHIYVCHELIAGNTTSITEEIKLATTIKRSLNSKKNPFWFLTVLNIDTTSLDIESYERYILEKINLINSCLKQNKIPPMDNKFVDTKGCFFCLFQQPCKQIP